VSTLQPSPRRSPRKPGVVPSSDPYVVPTRHPEGTTSGASLQDFWTREGVGLARLLADLWDVPESRIEISSLLDTQTRYDVALVPAREETWETMRTLMRDGITRHFGLEIVKEVRPMDVFVLRAPHGIADSGELHGGGSMSAYEVLDLEASSIEVARAKLEERFRARAGGVPGGFRPGGQISGSGSCTTEMLCRMLEGMMGRLVVDETGAGGGFDFNISSASGLEGFLDALRTLVGIEVTPDRRDVEMLVVRPA
jgi:uncharacterized protein (TIGR03435 family)